MKQLKESPMKRSNETKRKLCLISKKNCSYVVVSRASVSLSDALFVCLTAQKTP